MSMFEREREREKEREREATRAIQAGEEILYDYGDYSKDARDNFSFFKDCK